MGQTTRPGTSITDYWPDDTDTQMYIPSSSSLNLMDLFDKAKEKWPELVNAEQIEVTSEKIHTHCIYYDLYDAGDYTDFIVLTYVREK